MGRVAAGLGTVLLLVVIGARATASGAPLACGPASARTLAAHGQTRVYAVGQTVYACAGGGPSVRLGDSSVCVQHELVGPFALAGRVVAYGDETCGVDTGTSRVIVRSLPDGKVRHVFGAASLTAGPESYGRVLAIVVRADGATAWITSSQSIAGGRAPQVELDAFQKGSRSLVDSSAQIQTGSLKLRGMDLTWLDGTTARSYSLC
jgi:hypothetical protein